MTLFFIGQLQLGKNWLCRPAFLLVCQNTGFLFYNYNMLSARVAYNIKKDREEKEKQGIILPPVFRLYQESIAKIKDYKAEYNVYLYKTMRDAPEITNYKDTTYENIKEAINTKLTEGYMMYEIFLVEYGYYTDNKSSVSTSLLIRKSIYSF